MATARLIPSTYYISSSNLTVSSDTNMYANTDSTNYGTVTNTRSGTSSYYIYLRGFNFDSVPSDANVSSIAIKLKAYHSGGNTGTIGCYDGTTSVSSAGTGTALGTTSNPSAITFTNTTIDWNTLKNCGEDFGIRINCRRSNRNNTAYVYIYGAEIVVTYTVPVYYNVTVTGDSNYVNPTGTASVLEGSSYAVSMSYSSRPTVTDNNVDVSSQLVESTGGTSTLIPYDYTNNNFTISNIENAYNDATNTTYATFDAAGGGTARSVYLDLGGAIIPSTATITSVSCSATIQFSRNGSSSGVTASCQMYTGSTAKGSSTTITSSATDVAKTTFNLSIGSWTAAEISNARFYMTMTNSASSTHRYLYLYGVSFTVTYTINGKVYIYTVTNVATNHTIVVTAPAAAQDVAYIKVNGSWVAASAVYKKVSGSWVQQTNLSGVFESGVNYKLSS